MSAVITKLEIGDDKCFKNFNGPDEEFKDVNYIYGHNGHGKSTLAANLKRIAVNTGIDEEDIKHFSKEYIKEKVLVKETNDLRGIEGTFGENTKNATKIDELDGKIKQLQSEINGSDNQTNLYNQLEKNFNDAKKIIQKIHDSNKGELNLKFFDKNDFDEFKDGKGVYTYIINKICRDRINTAKNLGFAEEQIKSTTGNKDYDIDLETVKNLQIGTEEITETELKEVHEILKEPYSDNAIPARNIVDWLETGLELHDKEKNDECKFCKNHVDYQELEARIRQYQNDQKTKDSGILRDFNTKIKNILASLESSVSQKSQYQKYLTKEDYANYFGNKKTTGRLEKTKSTLEEIKTKIDNKIKNMTHIPALDLMRDDLVDEANVTSEIDSKLTKIHDNLTDAKSKIETIVKASIAYKITSDNGLIVLREKYNTLIADKNTKEKELIELTKEKIDIEQNLSSIAGFLKSANAFLKSINLNIKLKPMEDGKKCRILTNNNRPLTIKDISEGEKNLLALFFFYHELITSDGKNVDDNVKLIIVDDPLTSLDDNNQFYILELIKTIIENKNSAQVFVFTHSWHHFNDLAYRKKNDNFVRIFHLKKIDMESQLLMIDRPLGTMYSELFAFIDSFSKDDSPAQNEYLHAPNAMRRVIEEFMKFNYMTSDISSKSTINIITEALLDENYQNIPNDKKQKIRTLMAVSNILSHRPGSSPSNQDIHDSANFLIECFKSRHNLHYSKMVGNN